MKKTLTWRKKDNPLDSEAVKTGIFTVLEVTSDGTLQRTVKRTTPLFKKRFYYVQAANAVLVIWFVALIVLMVMHVLESVEFTLSPTGMNILLVTTIALLGVTYFFSARFLVSLIHRR